MRPVIRLRWIGASIALLSTAACSAPEREPEPVGEPADLFYVPLDPHTNFAQDSARKTTKPHIHDRMPYRLFETTLRPFDMSARLPTAFLDSITHRYQPWANRIYDVATIAFDHDTLEPLPQLEGRGYRDVAVNEVVIKMGGYNSSKAYISPEDAADIFRTTVTYGDDHVTVTSSGYVKHYFEDSQRSHLDERPLIVDCWGGSAQHCRTSLVFPPSFLRNQDGDHDEWRDGEGVGIEISFHPSLLPQWPEIRRKSACFALSSIVDAEKVKVFPRGTTPCADVENAFAKLAGKVVL